MKKAMKLIYKSMLWFAFMSALGFAIVVTWMDAHSRRTNTESPTCIEITYQNDTKEVLETYDKHTSLYNGCAVIYEAPKYSKRRDICGIRTIRDCDDTK